MPLSGTSERLDTPPGRGSRKGPCGQAILSALHRPVDGASLAAFRILFGLVMCGGLVRFMASGWIERFYGEPTYFFTYPGFGWIQPLSVPGMYAVYGVLAALALCIALGVRLRLAAAGFLIGFAYTQLIDVTNYLNHYLLVCWLALLLVLVPASRTWSVDAWWARRRGRPLGSSVPAWALYLLRFQVGVVYLFAGLAKLNSDWLLHAQPLGIWLSARTETPFIGPWLDEPWVAYVMSWGGFLFDTTIVLWLSWRRTRALAYAAVLGFHFLTHVFFNIGLFPFLMVVNATLFFDPSWPRKLLPARWRQRQATLAPVSQASLPRRARLGAIGLAAFATFHLLVPLRHYLHPGDVSWNELGMRYSWKVMLREKHGAVTYFVRMADGKQLQVSPRRYLDSRQEREMAGQPDLIAQLARHIARDFEGRGYGRVEVFAEALVSWNGRPPHPMIDPAVDLARDEAARHPERWILPEPGTAPIHLRARAGL